MSLSSVPLALLSVWWTDGAKVLVFRFDLFFFLIVFVRWRSTG
jgi:hypothetical protein